MPPELEDLPKPPSEEVSKVRAQGTTSLLNERMIQDCLSVPTTPENSEQIQSGAMLTVLDSFDRKVVRSYFVNIVNASFSLHSAMSRLHTLYVLKGMMEQPDFKKEQVDEALAKLTAYGEAKHKELDGMLAMLVQCPNDWDTIH